MPTKPMKQVNTRTSGREPNETPRNQEKNFPQGRFDRGTQVNIKFKTKK